MWQHLRIINGHKILSAKRKSGYKRDLTVFLMLSFTVLLLVSLLLAAIPKEDFMNIAGFIFPVLLLLDFSLRFFLKKSTTAGIFSYLCLPISRKTLILYMILSDLQQLWIWGCWLLYGIILHLCGILTFAHAVTLLFMLLFNNYLIAFVKTLTKGYALLIYPVCIGFLCVILFIINIFNPFLDIILSFLLMSVITVMLYYLLKEELYEELNCIAL
ncbi:MAG: hypothetical protein LBE91_16265 [Tannerella sp.]|jgi:hypothetical protein|nr:hypothetical protein [Tannerella sp.]